MKIKAGILLIFVCSQVRVSAQQFITKAVIEYEVTANIKKTMGNNMFTDMIKDQVPQFKTGYFDFTFANDKSIYKFDRWADESKRVPQWYKKSDEENVWYCDYEADKLNMQKSVAGGSISIEDSMRKMRWRITNDTRVIAGFNCRKAVAVMFDSVYVFAFYTDEIMISGGPCSINGLPGMTLGVTIPRLYTSWIATKVMLTGVDEKIIKPVSARKYYDLNYLKTTMIDLTKDWYTDNTDEKEDLQQQKARFIWGALL